MKNLLAIRLDSKYERLAVVFSVILLLLVCGTGYWVYSKLSTVADDIVVDRSKDSRLLLLKELNNDLVTAENYAFSYTITKKDSLLHNFYKLENYTAPKLGRLRDIPSNDPNYVRHIDTLTKLVHARFRTMEDLVLVQNENRVNDAMEQVIDEVKSMSRPKIVKPVAAPKKGSKAEKRRLFQRLLEERQAKKVEELSKKPTTVSTSTINAGLMDIKRDVVGEEQTKNARKLVVEQRNNRLIARFTQLIQTIENQEKKAILEEAEHAKQVASETNIIIALFCLTSVLLILFTSYLITLFVSKTKETNRQLLIAKQKSDQLTRSKSQFLANMSHEIRTPLNAIVGFTEQLRHSELKEAQQNKVGIIAKAADHLTKITNEILDLSKLNAGALKLEQIPFSITEEAGFVINTLDQIAANNGNTLKIHYDEELPKQVIGDPMRVRQILINLLGNALKFTENGTVSLSIKPDLQSAEETTLLLTVKDTGVGISPENLVRIFDEFEQAEMSVARNYGGTGLGLSITRMLVDRMNGKIDVKSEVGKGTTFTVSIPFAIAGSEEESAPAPVQNADLEILRNKSVLVVDDEAYNRKLLRNILEKAGVRMTEAADGNEALQALERSSYDLILLDLRMPNLDGFGTMKAIQGMEDKKHIPVIALTAAISSEERENMVRENWKGVLLKPFKLQELASSVSAVMHKLGNETETAANEGKTKAKPNGKTKKSLNTQVNLDPLRELSGDDSAFYVDMLSTLHRTTLDGIQTIQQTSGQQDWLGMAEAAHKIAAPVRHLNAIDIYEQLKNLEQAGRTNTIEPGIADKIHELNEAIQSLLQQIDTEIEQTRMKS